jgi:hypothetical protein
MRDGSSRDVRERQRVRSVLPGRARQQASFGQGGHGAIPFDGFVQRADAWRTAGLARSSRPEKSAQEKS